MAKKKRTKAQKLSDADFRALGTMNKAEKGVKPWELEGEQKIGGNPTVVRPQAHGETTTPGPRPPGLEKTGRTRD